MNPNRQLNRRFLSFIFLLLAVVANTAFGQDTNLLEEFVRSADREVVLKKLVPGTQQYYYLHALHYQNTNQLDKVDQVLVDWEKRFDSKSSQWKQMQHRQMPVSYTHLTLPTICSV